MAQAITLAHAIEMWRSLIQAEEQDDVDNSDLMVDLEGQILKTPIAGHAHAAAICEILALSIGGGERCDGSDVQAAERLRDWHLKLADQEAETERARGLHAATLTVCGCSGTT